MKLMIDDVQLAEQDPSSPIPRGQPVRASAFWLIALLILVAAIAVRVYPSAGFTGVGFDEVLYRGYVIKLDDLGLIGFPDICKIYLEDQRKPGAIAMLPPTRFLYVLAAWIWKRAEFGDAPPRTPNSLRDRGFAKHDPALVSLHRVACLFSVLGVVVAGVAAYRMLGRSSMLGVLALTASAPVSIHMGQHALVDGFFAFWATLCLWLLWENLRHPDNARWLAALGASLALMVLTKENSFFVYVGLAGLLVANRWAKFGAVTPRLIVAGIAGPLIGVLLLVLLAGGIAPFIEIYHLLVTKALRLPYAIETGDGPWHRYLVDMFLVSPLVLLLAIGGLFTQLGKNRAYVFLALFVGLTYAFMCNVKYGMNLRYATIWDLPLCALAVAQIDDLAKVFGRRQAFATTIAITALCAYGLRQYLICFSYYGLYELVTGDLLRAVNIVK